MLRGIIWLFAATLLILVALTLLPDDRPAVPAEQVELNDVTVVLYPRSDADAVWYFGSPSVHYSPGSRESVLKDLHDGRRTVGGETDFTLRLHLDRFERQANGEVLLAASWIVEGGASGAPLMIRSASIRETVGADSYDAIVAAMSRALDRLSLRIGAEVEGLQPADRDT